MGMRKITMLLHILKRGNTDLSQQSKNHGQPLQVLVCLKVVATDFIQAVYIFIQAAHVRTK